MLRNLGHSNKYGLPTFTSWDVDESKKDVVGFSHCSYVKKIVSNFFFWVSISQLFVPIDIIIVPIHQIWLKPPIS